MGTSSYLPIKTLCYLWLRCPERVFNADPMLSLIYWYMWPECLIKHQWFQIKLPFCSKENSCFENESISMTEEYADVPDNGGPYGLPMEAQIIHTNI
jgi:hypothetical protein